MRAWENDATGCPTGKHPYHSRHQADQARTRITRRHNRRPRARGHLNTYRCDQCPHYHLGNTTPRRRPRQEAA